MNELIKKDNAMHTHKKKTKQICVFSELINTSQMKVKERRLIKTSKDSGIREGKVFWDNGL